MPIYEKDNSRILHVHIPKTGGSSITELFRQNGWTVDKWSGGGNDQQHAWRKQWKEWGEFDFVFTVVRHPVFRALSDARGRVRDPDEVDHWIQNWCKEPYSLHGQHNRPQADFFNNEDGTVFYFNDKTHQKRLIDMAAPHDSPPSNLEQKYPHVKDGDHKSHSPSLLSLLTLETIQETYRKDMEEFNFHWLGLEDL